MKLWQIAVLLIAGIGVGALWPGLFAYALQAAALYVFLPALIFEAAWQLNFRIMRRAWRPIVLLAFPGVVVTAAIVAAVVHFLGGLALGGALLLGAVLSATDPVAVVAIFRKLNVPAALATIVESEALLNDAVAVVLYRAVVAAIVAGAVSGGVAQIAAYAMFGSVAGVAIGIAAAFACAFALRENVKPVVQGAVTFAAAYVVFFAAERVHASGIFAVIALAVAMRSIEGTQASLAVVESVDRAWIAASTVANVALFFLIGASVNLSRLWGERGVVLWTMAGVLVARAVIAYGLLAFVPGLAQSWKVVVRLAGVRGALSLALALGLPAAVASRSTIVEATFGVVVLTILLGTLTYERRIGALDL